MRLILVDDDDGGVLANAAIVVSDAQGNEFKYKEVDNVLANAINSGLSTPSSIEGMGKYIKLQNKFKVAISFLGISGLIQALRELEHTWEQHATIQTAQGSELIDCLAQAISSVNSACEIIKNCSPQAVEDLGRISDAIQDWSTETVRRTHKNSSSDDGTTVSQIVQTKSNDQKHEYHQPSGFERTFIRQRSNETWLETASRIFSDDGFHSFEELFFSNQELAEGVADELWSLHEKIALAWNDKFSKVIETDGVSGHSDAESLGHVKNNIRSLSSNTIDYDHQTGQHANFELKSPSLESHDRAFPHFVQGASQLGLEPGRRQRPPGFEVQPTFGTRLELQQTADFEGQDVSRFLPPAFGHAAGSASFWGHHALDQSAEPSFDAPRQVQASPAPVNWYISSQYHPPILRPPPGLDLPSSANTKLMVATPSSFPRAPLAVDTLRAKTPNSTYSALEGPFRPANGGVGSERVHNIPTTTTNAWEESKASETSKEQNGGMLSATVDAKQSKTSDSVEQRVSSTFEVSGPESPTYKTWAQRVSSTENDHSWSAVKGIESSKSTKAAQHCPITGQRLGRWCSIKGLRKNMALSDITKPIDFGPIAAVEIGAIQVYDGSCSAAVLFLWDQSARDFVKDGAHEPYGANVSIELGQWYDGTHDLTGMVRFGHSASYNPGKPVQSRRIILSGPSLFLTNKKIRKLVSKGAGLPPSAIESISVHSGGCAEIVFANVWSAGRVQQTVTATTTGEFRAARAAYAKDKGEKMEKKEI